MALIIDGRTIGRKDFRIMTNSRYTNPDTPERKGARNIWAIVENMPYDISLQDLPDMEYREEGLEVIKAYLGEKP